MRLGAKSPIGDLAPLSDNKLVEIICYALLPNHFHILLKQITENGISRAVGGGNTDCLLFTGLLLRQLADRNDKKTTGIIFSKNNANNRIPAKKNSCSLKTGTTRICFNYRNYF